MYHVTIIYRNTLTERRGEWNLVKMLTRIISWSYRCVFIKLYLGVFFRLFLKDIYCFKKQKVSININRNVILSLSLLEAFRNVTHTQILKMWILVQLKEILLTIKRDFTYKYSTLEKNFVKGMKLVGKGCGLRAKEIVSARPVPNQAAYCWQPLPFLCPEELLFRSSP